MFDFTSVFDLFGLGNSTFLFDFFQAILTFFFALLGGGGVA